MPAEISTRFSDWVQNVLSCIFQGDREENVGGTHLLRKMAHFLEFACLGACLGWLVGMVGRSLASVVWMPVLGGFTVACLDESIQLFAPGRGPSFLDVGIDTLGAAVGMIFLLTGYYIQKYLFIRRCTK